MFNVQYQKLTKDENLYKSTIISLPAPRFIVLYNGLEKRPEKEILKLSDAYYKREDEPNLELLVTVLNINAGNNVQLMERCRTLKEYMEFVECVRIHLNVENAILEKAIERANDECIEKGILTEFLKKNRAEAVTMCVLLWNEEEKEKLRKVEHRDGYNEGLKRGKEELLNELVLRNSQIGKSVREIAEILGIDEARVVQIIELGK